MLGGAFGFHDEGPLKGLPLRLHTSDLNTEDFNDLMAYTNQIAAENGVLILDPSEWKAAKRKQLRRGTGSASRGLPPVVGVPEGEKPSIAPCGDVR
jgi:hypothetical protein